MKSIRHYIKRIKAGKLREIRKEIHWVYRYARPHAGQIIVFTLLGLSGTLVSLISSLVSRDLVDIITGHKTGELLTTFVAMIGVTLGSAVIGQASSYLSNKINLSVDNDVKADLFDEIMGIEWESLAKYHSGELVARWNSDASIVASGILSLIPNTIIYTFRFISSLYMVVSYDASFAIFALIGIPVSIIASRRSMVRLRKGNMSTLTISTKMSAFNQETFSNLQLLKSFDILPIYSERLRALQKEYTDARMKYQRVEVINAMILTIVSMVVSYSAQGWGVYKVWSGAITYGTMTMFLTLSNSLTAGANSVISLFPSSIALLNSTKRLMDLTSLPKEDYSQKSEVKEFFEAHSSEGVGMYVNDIAYGYGDAEDVFSGVSLNAAPHEAIALVGPSGEGKTTMMRCLLSLVRLREGAGYLTAGQTEPSDGECMPLSASVRQLIAYVPQGNTMLSGTIAENMRNVKKDATDDEIVEALKMACAWKFVEKLPEGINSPIGERGSGFSEGQAQRMSIARALLRKSPILLLDEATSALDMETERTVLKNIMENDYPRTCIVTTHRPSVLKSCSRVYSIHDGRCDLLNAEQIDRLVNG